jgi:5-hydroxyisourate hydrolase-like protein (transthyretin family)
VGFSPGEPNSSVLLFVLTALLAIASLPAHPQSHTSAPGYYSIAGKVINSVTGDPVRRATVSVLAQSDSHTIASTTTDSEGHFALENLPAAKYQLAASRRGFRTAFYDQHDDFNTAIVTGPSQDTESLIFRLTPGSILHGVVTADGGDPVKDAEVMLFRKPQAHRQGERIAQAGSTTTDDTGAYEFGNLAAGEYLLAVKADPWYEIHPSNAESRPRPANDLDVAYPITYYDSTADEAQASPIVLSGGNREEADFNLHAVPALHITLEAPRSDDDSSPSSTFTLHQSIFGVRDLSEIGNISMNSKQGLIEFSGVAPGRYELSLPNPPRVVDLDATISQQVDPAAEIPTVVVTGTLQTVSGYALPGETTVTLDSLDPAHRENPVQTTCIQGAFRFESVPPGSWQLSAINSGSLLPITSISTGSRAHAGNHLTVRDRPLSITVTIGLGETSIEGFARINGKGLPGVMMVLLPNTNSRPLWQALIRRDQSDSDGSFSLRDVVPGQYTVVAIQDGWAIDWTDPQLLARYLSAGINVTVTGSSGKLVTLSLPVPVQTRN